MSVHLGRTAKLAFSRAMRTAYGGTQVLLWIIAVWNFGPIYEERFDPIAKTLDLRVVSRTQDKICWEHTVKRRRAAESLFFVWRMEIFGNPETDVAIRPVSIQTGRPFLESELAKPGETRVYRQCVMLPALFQEPGLLLQVRARGVYTPAHGLWEVKREVGPYLILDQRSVRLGSVEPRRLPYGREM